MVYDLIPQSVEIKTTIFDPPARLINHMELLCAVGMAFHQAGLPLPEVAEGAPLKETADGLMSEVQENPRVSPKLIAVIQGYIYKTGETADKDAVISMRMGYEYE